jgi:hypothetical protein
MSKSSVRISVGTLAGAAVVVLTYIVELFVGYIDIPKEVEAAFVTIATFILSIWLD